MRLIISEVGADRLDDALHGDGILVPMRAPGAPEPRVDLSPPPGSVAVVGEI